MLPEQARRSTSRGFLAGTRSAGEFGGHAAQAAQQGVGGNVGMYWSKRMQQESTKYHQLYTHYSEHYRRLHAS